MGAGREAFRAWILPTCGPVNVRPPTRTPVSRATLAGDNPPKDLEGFTPAPIADEWAPIRPLCPLNADFAA